MAEWNNRAKVRSGQKASSNVSPATILGQWPNVNELFRKRYQFEIDTPFNEEEWKRTEGVLGVRLPKNYERLLRERNGGSLRYNSILLKRAPKTFYMSGRVYCFDSIAGIHRSHSYGLTQRAQIAGEGWGVPKGMIALDGDGHWWLCLDYRKCGPRGEPTVVHWDQPDPITNKLETFKVADTFEQLITHLQFDTDYLFALDGSGVDENGLADRLKKLGCTKLPGNHPRWKWRQYCENIYGHNPLEMFVTDNGEHDPWHLARPARHRLLYVPVRKEDSRKCIAQLAEALGDDAELLHQPIDYRHIKL
jgi:hypothetical protein